MSQAKSKMVPLRMSELMPELMAMQEMADEDDDSWITSPERCEADNDSHREWFQEDAREVTHPSETSKGMQYSSNHYSDYKSYNQTYPSNSGSVKKSKVPATPVKTPSSARRRATASGSISIKPVFKMVTPRASGKKNTPLRLRMKATGSAAKKATPSSAGYGSSMSSRSKCSLFPSSTPHYSSIQPLSFTLENKTTDNSIPSSIKQPAKEMLSMKTGHTRNVEIDTNHSHSERNPYSQGITSYPRQTNQSYATPQSVNISSNSILRSCRLGDGATPLKIEDINRCPTFETPSTQISFGKLKQMNTPLFPVKDPHRENVPHSNLKTEFYIQSSGKENHRQQLFKETPRSKLLLDRKLPTLKEANHNEAQQMPSADLKTRRNPDSVDECCEKGSALGSSKHIESKKVYDNSENVIVKQSPAILNKAITEESYDKHNSLEKSPVNVNRHVVEHARRDKHDRVNTLEQAVPSANKHVEHTNVRHDSRDRFNTVEQSPAVVSKHVNDRSNNSRRDNHDRFNAVEHCPAVSHKPDAPVLHKPDNHNRYNTVEHCSPVSHKPDNQDRYNAVDHCPPVSHKPDNHDRYNAVEHCPAVSHKPDKQDRSNFVEQGPVVLNKHVNEQARHNSVGSKVIQRSSSADKQEVLPVKTVESRSDDGTGRKAKELDGMQNSIRFQTMSVKGKQYTILGKVGFGGSSEVFKVMDPQTSSMYAVKCVNLAVDHSIAQGYINEVKLLQKLQGSDGVITMHAFEYLEKQRKLYVLMEMGDVDLSSFIKSYWVNKKQLPPPLVVYYWTEMLAAVLHIHQNGIIHSDLKPANFLLVQGRLKLIDFGIATSVSADATSVMRDSATGTFNYISPEAVSPGCGGAASFKINYKSDVWSLGCILYSMLYGHTPFSHVTHPLAKMAALSNPKHQINYPELKDMPPALTKALRWCLTYEVKARPTVQELIDIRYCHGAQSWPIKNRPTTTTLAKIRAALNDDEWKTVVQSLEN